MAEKDPGKIRGRKSMGLRNVEVGIPQEDYDLLEKYAGRGGIANVIRAGVRAMVNSIDDEDWADCFPLRWVEGAERSGVRRCEPVEKPLTVGDVVGAPDGSLVDLRVEVKGAPKRVIPAKLDPDAAKMLEAIRARARSGRTLANDLGMDIMTAGAAISVLTGAGLVMRRRDGIVEAV